MQESVLGVAEPADRDLPNLQAVVAVHHHGDLSLVQHDISRRWPIQGQPQLGPASTPFVVGDPEHPIGVLGVDLQEVTEREGIDLHERPR